jgi:hypothetical protein
LFCVSLGFAVCCAQATDTSQTRPALSAAQIVEKNVAARGGLQAWRGVEALSMSGRMDAGGNNRPTLPVPGQKISQKVPAPQRPAEQVQLPFTIELKRPRKVRVELQFNGQTALQVFDGAHGWKLRPFLNRREVESYTAEELKSASSEAPLDGFLVDYAAKGTKVELDGLEKVGDRDTYKLKVTLNNGQAIHLWIDAATFLETRLEGTPRRLDGKYHPVDIYYKDFRQTNGLMIPYLLETVVEDLPGVKDQRSMVERIIVEKVVVNPKLDESLFAKPQI